MFTSILRTVMVMKKMSVKDRLERKKYMGVWRWGSVLIARILSRFPSTVTRYIVRNSAESTG
jgi:IS30 family transposase